MASTSPVTLAWGFGGSALQMEGSWNIDGKGPNVFDTAYLNHALHPTHGTPYRAADHYNQSKSDLAYLSQLGATAYRFSFSWSRIMPYCNGTINQAGINYYNNYIDQIKANGAEPFATMFHWDLPQACQDNFKGFQTSQIIDAFANYAEVLLTNFGPKINYWLTLNEPRANCDFCMWVPQFAPFTNNTEAMYYECMHNSIIAHGTVVTNARAMPNSANWRFSLPSIMEWHDPDPGLTDTAAPTANEGQSTLRQAEWYFDPCFFGDYGAGIKVIHPLIPSFTPQQSALIKGTCDFVAVNIYSSFTDATPEALPIGEVAADPTQEVDDMAYHFDMPYWPHPRPEGTRMLPNFLYKRYGKEIVISELGYHVPRTLEQSFEAAVKDTLRVQFWQLAGPELLAVINEDKVPLKAVLAWSLIDNYEFYTYEFRWGHIAVDYWDPSGNGKVNLDTGSLKRQVKDSAKFMSQYFTANTKNPFNNPVTVSGDQTGSVGAGAGTGSGTGAPSAGTTATTKKNSGVAIVGSMSALVASFMLF
ncbi:hypothetical protein HDU98_001435 [Podochytrium sp. JEL0797]|nr:hypothetical protein HDU98_001435 [Podochytrium sp. JEL0797]